MYHRKQLIISWSIREWGIITFNHPRQVISDEAGGRVGYYLARLIKSDNPSFPNRLTGLSDPFSIQHHQIMPINASSLIFHTYMWRQAGLVLYDVKSYDHQRKHCIERVSFDVKYCKNTGFWAERDVKRCLVQERILLQRGRINNRQLTIIAF